MVATGRKTGLNGLGGSAGSKPGAGIPPGVCTGAPFRRKRGFLRASTVWRNSGFQEIHCEMAYTGFTGGRRAAQIPKVTLCVGSPAEITCLSFREVFLGEETTGVVVYREKTGVSRGDDQNG